MATNRLEKKIFISVIELISNIYKESNMIYSKETNNHKKWSAELNKEFSRLNDWEAPKEMFNIVSWLGKCKSKQTWDFTSHQLEMLR